MDEKDKIIASLRKQLGEVNSRVNALEQEIALLQYEIERTNREYFQGMKSKEALKY